MRFYEDLKKTSENRLAPRSYYIPEGKSEYMLLNGTWRFNYYKRDIDVPEEFSSWDEIPVPSCWQALGYENPNYTSSNFPFPADPPYVPDDNPCGIYERDFTLEDKWGKVYFVLEGVSSLGILYVNNQYVGFTEGSHLQAEFDITDYVVSGKNTLRLKVLKWCVGSYLEDQDFFRFNGIFRDCYILKRPLDHITDFSLYSKDNAIIFKSDKAANITLYDANGNVLAEKTDTDNTALKVENPIYWNAEKPYLYTVKICRNGEEIIRKTAFRTIEISNEYELLINGVPVKLHGVNHHDTHPTNGWVQTDEELRHDLELMKELNINTIRTSHYPPTPKFIDMCDEMGFYVLLETDLESHGFLRRLPRVPYHFDVDKPIWPCVNPEWKDEFLERMKRAVGVFKNSPAIIIWSTSNESGYGPNHEVMIDWLHSLNDNRLVHCEDASRKGDNSKVDLFSGMYLPIEKITELAKDDDVKMPVFLCEYSHCMGNGPGDVYEYNVTFDKYKKLIGGCVWEWADHTVIEDGVQKYGGDFEGEMTHHVNFCCDGMVFADRSFRAGTYEVKTAYQPIYTEYKDNILSVYNRYDFTNLTEYDFEYTIQVDGKDICKKSLKLSNKPHCTTEHSVEFKKCDCKLGAYIICRLYKDGKEVARTQNPLPCNIIKENRSETPAKFKEDKYDIYITGKDFSYTFSKHYGCFTDISVKGKKCLEKNVELSLWRAPIDNDRFIKQYWDSNWEGENIDFTFNKIYSVDVSDGKIFVKGSYSGVSREPILRYTVEYNIDCNGRVDVSFNSTVREDAFFLPRLGFEYTLPSSDNSFTYFGRGPLENYCDMHHGSYISEFKSTAEKEYVNFVVPQEHGNHINVKKLEISGLKFTCQSENGMEINVSKYTSKEITKATHTNELHSDGFIHLRIDYKVSGLGSHSCGPELMDKYKLKEKEISFNYSFEPLV